MSDKDASADDAETETTDEGFWDWSNGVYRLAGVADRLIALQDAHRLDVNLVLWCVWTGLTRGAAKPKAVRKALAASEDWNSQVVKPLRAARKALKSAPDEADGADALKKKVKEAELDAERIEQSLLESLAPKETEGPAGAEAALANLQSYREAADAQCPDDVFEALLAALTAETDAD